MSSNSIFVDIGKFIAKKIEEINNRVDTISTKVRSDISSFYTYLSVMDDKQSEFYNDFTNRLTKSENEFILKSKEIDGLNEDFTELETVFNNNRTNNEIKFTAIDNRSNVNSTLISTQINDFIDYGKQNARDLSELESKILTQYNTFSNSILTEVANEKSRIDAILHLSDDSKDSFIEIVNHIASIDTENDANLSTYIVSNNARSQKIESDVQTNNNNINSITSSFNNYKTSNDVTVSSLNTQLNTERNRVNAILNASSADKDSFAEIVDLINNIDTENDDALVTFKTNTDNTLSSHAAQLSNRYTKDESDNRFLGVNQNAVSATKLQTARTLTLSGDADSNSTFDGSTNVNLQVSLNSNKSLANPALTFNENTISLHKADGTSESYDISEFLINEIETQDIVGGMVTGNSDSGIVSTYNSTTKKLDFGVEGFQLSKNNPIYLNNQNLIIEDINGLTTSASLSNVFNTEFSDIEYQINVEKERIDDMLESFADGESVQEAMIRMEETARINADNNIQLQIDDVYSLMSDDSERLKAIQDVTNAYINADNDVLSSLSEISTSIHTKIDTAINERTDTDNTIINDLNNEIQNRQNDSNDRYTKIESDSKFVNVTGDTISSNLTFNNTATGVVWTMNTDGAAIKFYNNGDSDTDSRLEFQVRDNSNEFFRWTNSSIEKMTLKGGTLNVTDNITVNGIDVSLDTHTHSYLPLSGGTMSGNLTMQSATPTIFFNGTSDAGVDMAIKATPEGLDFYEPEDGNKIHFQILDDTGVNSPYGYKVGSHTVWHSGNDGSGSGLDADKLDGHDSSYFAKATDLQDSEHSHSNKSVIDKLGVDSNSNLTYNGNKVDTIVAQRDVYNGLDSNNTTVSLSAAQGKKLFDEKLDKTQKAVDSDKLDGHDSSYFAVQSHTHSYLPLSGGTLSNDLTMGVGADINLNYSGQKITFGESYGKKGYIQHSVGGQIKVGTDDKFDIYETDNNTLAIEISANRKTLDAKGGLKEAGVLLSNKYALKSHSHNYLSNSGGTIYGNLLLTGQKDNFDGYDRSAYWDYDTNVALALQPAADNGATAIVFKSVGNAPSDFAYIVYDEDYPEAGVTSGEVGALILSSQNDGKGSSDHVRVKSRLVVEADMASSDPTYAFQVKATNSVNDLFSVKRDGNVFVGGYTVWHSGNDGSKSGLDADKLDGNDSSYFAKASNEHTHSNKTVLDELGVDSSNNLTYNGNKIDTVIAQRDVYNGLNSTDTTISLSAAQGKKLFDDKLGKLEKASDSDKLDGHDSTYFARASKEHLHTNITVLNKIDFNDENKFTIDKNEIWHSGNDGSGSGLDADTIDGKHASVFALNDEIISTIELDDKDLIFTQKNGTKKVVSLKALIVPEGKGGTITTDGDYSVHTFNNSGTFTIDKDVYVQIFCIGGGAGGAGHSVHNNGGGGGGLSSAIIKLKKNEENIVVVGAGGSTNSDGGTTMFKKPTGGIVLSASGGKSNGVGGAGSIENNNDDVKGLHIGRGGAGGAAGADGSNGVNGGPGGGGGSFSNEVQHPKKGGNGSAEWFTGGGGGPGNDDNSRRWPTAIGKGGTGYYNGGNGAHADTNATKGGGTYGGKAGTNGSRRKNAGGGGGAYGGGGGAATDPRNGSANTSTNAGSGGSGVVIIKYLINGSSL